jgi:hypothetical protein
MLNKKGEGKGKCPFRKLKSCEEGCILYRKGIRYNEKTEVNFPFENCAINIIADNLEAMHQRTFMLQSEVGQTKNATLLKILVDLGMEPPEELQRQFKKMVTAHEPSKQLEE